VQVLGNHEFSEPERLAMLSLAYIAEQDCVALVTDTAAGRDPAYRDVMLSALWIYLLHSYLELIRVHRGHDMALAVQSLQCALFDREQPGSGDAMASAIQLVDIALEVLHNEDITRSGYSLPVELGVSLALLLGLPESPDYHRADRRSLHDGKDCQTSGVDERMADILHSGKRKLLEAFSPLFLSPVS
jgi:hypothetical protein